MRAFGLWGVSALPICWAAIEGRLSGWEAAAYLGVLAGAVLLSRPRPVPAMVLVIAAWQVCFLSHGAEDSALGMTMLAVGMGTLSFLAGRRADDAHHGVVALILGTASAVTAALLVTGGADTAIAAGAGVAVLTVLPWSLGRYRRRFAELVRAGWDYAEQWERSAEQAAEQARTRERTLLAADLHDLVGHELAQAALRVGALEVSATLSTEDRDAARAARAAVTSAAERLADAVRLLRPASEGSQEATVASVEQIVANARGSGLAVELSNDGVEPTDPVIARTIHRVLTESITNVIKHAPGAAVTVRLAQGDGGPTLRIVNGPAQHTSADDVGGGHGLRGLTERVTLVGGRFDSRSLPDGGFEVSAVLPQTPVTTITSSTSATREQRTLAEQQVRRGARRAVLLAAGISVAVLLSAAGYRVFDATTSLLEPSDFQRLRLGQAEARVAELLPPRTRVDNPEGTLPAPAGAHCRHYSTHPNPFDQRRLDLYRLCFREGRLVDKALLVRGP